MGSKNIEGPGSVLVESEVRFREALGRLSVALENSRHMKDRIVALEAEKRTLEDGLASLKSDYESLEKSFLELQIKVDAGIGNSIKGRELNAENDALKKEVSIVRKDYETMEQSFGLLKTQFLDAQQKEPASSKRAARQLKAGIAEKLDGTIMRLERMLEANDA